MNANNGNAGGGFYSEGGQFYYVRGLARLHTVEDIGKVVVAVRNGTPILVRDLGDVIIGHAPRLGQFGFNERNDAVEGVIVMRRGEQAQVVLKGVQAKTRELNDSILPRDVKIRPYYDRSDLVHLTTRTVEDNLLRGILLVVVGNNGSAPPATPALSGLARLRRRAQVLGGELVLETLHGGRSRTGARLKLTLPLSAESAGDAAASATATAAPHTPPPAP